MRAIINYFTITQTHPIINWVKCTLPKIDPMNLNNNWVLTKNPIRLS